MATYKVYFSGYAIVDADDEDEAIENAQDDLFIYETTAWTNVEEFIGY